MKHLKTLGDARKLWEEYQKYERYTEGPKWSLKKTRLQAKLALLMYERGFSLMRDVLRLLERETMFSIDWPSKQDMMKRQIKLEELLYNAEKKLADLNSIGVDTILFCPTCRTQHIDKGEWGITLHKTHLCEKCGHKWKPYPVPTFGVKKIEAPCDPDDNPFI